MFKARIFRKSIKMCHIKFSQIMKYATKKNNFKSDNMIKKFTISFDNYYYQLIHEE